MIDDPGLWIAADPHSPDHAGPASAEAASSLTEPANVQVEAAKLRRRSSGSATTIVRRRIVLLVTAVTLATILFSYLSAVTGPGTDPLSARSVEWMRDHHLGAIVDAAERRWYEHHQAKVGGTPNVSTATPQLASAGSAGGAGDSSGTGDPSASTVESQPTAASPSAANSPSSAPSAGVRYQTHPLQAPAALTSPASVPVDGEGQWHAIDQTSRGTPGAFATLIRPDSVHTSVLDAVVWMDPHLVRLRQYPGSRIPGSPWDRPDHIETERQRQLVAAFNGGFRLGDSHGGMILGNKQIAAMRPGAATLLIDPNGVPDIGAWGRDINPNQPMDSARQNLDLIVDGGAPVSSLLSDPNRRWGFTGPANKSAVWRSGAGITADGALVWVGGPGLTTAALAETLVRAGAIRGMQLDINQDWVQLNSYAIGRDGQVTGTKILSGMRHTGNRWLTEDTRDFIAVYTRSS